MLARSSLRALGCAPSMRVRHLTRRRSPTTWIFKWFGGRPHARQAHVEPLSRIAAPVAHTR